MVYKTFSNIREIPTNTDVTVVTLSSEYSAINDAIDIQDYRNGEKIGDETYHTISDVSDEILRRGYQKEVYVQKSAEITFNAIWEYGEIYRDKNGDLDAIAEELDIRMSNMRDEREFESEE